MTTAHERMQAALEADIAGGSNPLQRIEMQLAALVKVIGSESEDGETGNGIVGRMMRIEKAQLRSDRWINRLAGGFAVISMLATAIWWVVKDKISHFIA